MLSLFLVLLLLLAILAGRAVCVRSAISALVYETAGITALATFKPIEVVAVLNLLLVVLRTVTLPFILGVIAVLGTLGVLGPGTTARSRSLVRTTRVIVTNDRIIDDLCLLTAPKEIGHNLMY